MRNRMMILFAAAAIALPLGTFAFAEDQAQGQTPAAGVKQHKEKGAGQRRLKGNQNGEKGGANIDRIKERLAGLDLTDQQKEQVKSILAKAREQVAEARKTGDKDQVRTIVRSAMQELSVALRAVRQVAVSTRTATNLVVNTAAGSYSWTNAKGQTRTYGLPVDNRTTTCLIDWAAWSIALAREGGFERCRYQTIPDPTPVPPDIVALGLSGWAVSRW